MFKRKVQYRLENSDELKLILYEKDFEEVTDMSDAYWKDIKDITGIQYFTKLEKINLRVNDIKDFSDLSNLINLKELDISYTLVDNLAFLENLTKLESLKCSRLQLKRCKCIR